MTPPFADAADPAPPAPDPDALAAFIATWSAATGSERANYQLFLTQLCALLDLPQPEPARADPRANAYTFERRVDLHHPDGSVTRGFIDLYRRACFVLEAKRTGKDLETPGWDQAMLAAHHQSDRYARALPADEGRPPLLVLVDVGRSIELYSDFTCSGATYVPYPDPGQHRIRLADLHDPRIRDRLRQVWLDPHRLDPSRYAARVTRQISRTLADLARALEQQGYPVPRVARFLMRCLFTLFAEDVELLPKGGFTALLERLRSQPEQLAPALKSLWGHMNHGEYDGHFLQRLRRFNGGLFADADPIPLRAEQIDQLIAAGRADWRFVEPAIFGTLLERALDPRERHQLGAHYTPRAYVERLVLPTVIAPLRRDWTTVQVAAQAWLQQGKPEQARQEIRTFHYQLCRLRILDPACGSGNFLYVTLEHLKRLEGEVRNRLHDLGETQTVLAMAGQTVDPQQFLGLEINPRAAAIAEMVLWIGFLQWHYRINRRLDLPEPILRDFHNIENRDALLEYDAQEPMLDAEGQPVTRWDGLSLKPSPVTGEPIPDERQRTPVYRYRNPRPAAWPPADFIIGNPPFIGAAALRRALGDGYVDALRQTWKEIPESADLVMYWWHRAAEAVRTGQAQRFGLITTNSLRQTFNRRVIEPHLTPTPHPNPPPQGGREQLSLVFAIPDHPWVEAADGAAVRIAMTVGVAGDQPGTLRQVIQEQGVEDDARQVRFNSREGKILADLRIGANVAGVGALRANDGLCYEGIKPHGMGFLVTPQQAQALGLGRIAGLERQIREYRNGRDLTATPRGVMIIDLFGLTAEQVQRQYPEVYQWVLERVKPERDQNNRASRKLNWWLFGENYPKMRVALSGLFRYIVTVKTAKHRTFSFLDSKVLHDSKLIAIAIDDACVLGVLSSRVHLAWSTASGSTLEDRPTYVVTRCFETFPFPETTADPAARIRELAERLDAHRKRQQAQYPDLTLTGLYNVLEQLRTGETLSAKDRTIHQQGLVSVLRELHDALDRTVFDAYGWSDLAEALVGRPGATTPWLDKPAAQAEAEEELLVRLVALNHQRAAEEAGGHLRWLRPTYQAPEATQTRADLGTTTRAATLAPAEVRPRPWPKTLREQVETLRDLLADGPRTLDQLAAHFQRKPAKAVRQLLDALAAMGLATEQEGVWRLG